MGGLAPGQLFHNTMNHTGVFNCDDVGEPRHGHSHILNHQQTVGHDTSHAINQRASKAMLEGRMAEFANDEPNVCFALLHEP